MALQPERLRQSFIDHKGRKTSETRRNAANHGDGLSEACLRAKPRIEGAIVHLCLAKRALMLPTISQFPPMEYCRQSAVYLQPDVAAQWPALQPSGIRTRQHPARAIAL